MTKISMIQWIYDNFLSIRTFAAVLGVFLYGMVNIVPKNDPACSPYRGLLNRQLMGQMEKQEAMDNLWKNTKLRESLRAADK